MRAVDIEAVTGFTSAGREQICGRATLGLLGELDARSAGA
jgi:hypothetical protein